MFDHGQMDGIQPDLRAGSVLVGELLPVDDVEVDFIIALPDELFDLGRRQDEDRIVAKLGQHERNVVL